MSNWLRGLAVGLGLPAGYLACELLWCFRPIIPSYELDIHRYDDEQVAPADSMGSASSSVWAPWTAWKAYREREHRRRAASAVYHGYDSGSRRDVGGD